jgi:hypothetical protein
VAPDFSASYTFVNALGYGNDYPAGWLISAGASAGRLGVVGEVGGNYKTLSSFGSGPDFKSRMYTFLGGPRITAAQSGRTIPFGQLLLGVSHVGNNYGAHINSFTWEPGGGVDVVLARYIALRLQAELVLIEPGGGTIKEFRAAIGGAIRKF